MSESKLLARRWLKRDVAKNTFARARLGALSRSVGRGSTSGDGAAFIPLEEVIHVR